MEGKQKNPDADLCNSLIVLDREWILNLYNLNLEIHSNFSSLLSFQIKQKEYNYEAGFSPYSIAGGARCGSLGSRIQFLGGNLSE